MAVENRLAVLVAHYRVVIVDSEDPILIEIGFVILVIQIQINEVSSTLSIQVVQEDRRSTPFEHVVVGFEVFGNLDAYLEAVVVYVEDLDSLRKVGGRSLHLQHVAEELVARSLGGEVDRICRRRIQTSDVDLILAVGQSARGTRCEQNGSVGSGLGQRLGSVCQVSILGDLDRVDLDRYGRLSLTRYLNSKHGRAVYRSELYLHYILVVNTVGSPGCEISHVIGLSSQRRDRNVVLAVLQRTLDAGLEYGLGCGLRRIGRLEDLISILGEILRSEFDLGRIGLRRDELRRK